MKLYRARLIERIKRTPTVESFRFLPGEKIGFIPGQFAQLIFDEAHPDNRELNKYLSFSSSPAREYIEVTKRLSASAFSLRLRGLRIGEEVCLKAPMGSCVFHDTDRKIAFLIGGIGITPVISIIEHIVDRRLDTDVLLMYSNRTDEEIAFRQEIERWQSMRSNIKSCYTLTDCQPKDDRCIFGCIDRRILQEYIQDAPERLFYIFGPPRMVEEMHGLCLEIGCDKAQVKTESFIGY